MTEVIQIDTFNSLVAEKDGEIVYLKYVTLFVSSALEKPEIVVLFILFSENYIDLSLCETCTFQNAFLSPSIYKLEIVKWILPSS